MEEIMGTPFYHTDESALETIQDYQNMHGLENIEDAIVDMEFCIDDLDNEDRGALNHYRRVNK
jgi:hypothetical protein